MKYRLLSLLLCATGLFAQTIDAYSVYLKPKQIPNLMGLQSFAFGQHAGKWVIIGGRLDGLHRRQPFAAFDSIGHNNQVLVIDPVTNELWKAPVDQLAPALRDQLKATNIGFTQENDRLVLVGGYGISDSSSTHKTFPFLITVDLPDLIAAVQHQQLNDNLFHQTEDTLFAVTGSQLVRMNGIFHIVGGHRFDGRYNPADRPTFTQTYTNSVRRFTLDASGNPTFLAPFVSPELMHRRDFNVAVQQNAAGESYITAFSGVFQYGADLPFLSAVHIDESGIYEQPDFRQYYNHYHCPDVSLYDAATGDMHTLFFGGIAQFYDSLGVLLQDNDVPFVSTISRVTRHADGSMTEYRLPVEMPALLGAGGEFIVNRGLEVNENGLLSFQPEADSVFLGTIVGGIASTGRNIFWINDDAESAAQSGMFEVYLVKSAVPQIENKLSNASLNLRAMRHATEPRYELHFTLEHPSQLMVEWSNAKGKIRHHKIRLAAAGEQVYPYFLPKKPGLYKIRLKTNDSENVFYFKVPEEG